MDISMLKEIDKRRNDRRRAKSFGGRWVLLMLLPCLFLQAESAFSQDAGISGYVEELGVVGNPIEGIIVSAWLWNGADWLVEDDTTTAADGTYSITGLNAGTYRVQFTSQFGNYSEQWYDAADSIATATDIVLGTNDVATDIDSVMELLPGPYASVFEIFGEFDFIQQITDAEFASGNYLVVMRFEDLDGVETVNTNPPFFKPRFSVFTLDEEPIYTNQTFESYTYLNAGSVQSSNTQQQAVPHEQVDLGLFKIRWSAANSNGVPTLDSDVTAGSYFIDFEGEGEEKDHFSGDVVHLGGHDWWLENALIGDTDFDKKEGMRSLRIRRQGEGISGVMDMMEDRLNGIRHISLLFAGYGNNPDPPHIAFQVSTNSGVSWFDVGEPIVPTGITELEPFIVPVRIDGTIRVRIIVTGAGNQGHRTNVDNIRILDFPAANEAEFLVIDDDITPPTAPSNVAEEVTGWTNVNAFPISWDEAYDPPDVRTGVSSGIYQYRIAPGRWMLTYDGFDYGVGASLNGQNGGVGWNGAWATSGAFAIADPAPLSFALYEGAAVTGDRYVDAGSIGAVAGRHLDAPGVFADFSAEYGGQLQIGGVETSMWMSVLLRKTQPGLDTNATFMSLHRHATDPLDDSDEILRLGYLGGEDLYWGMTVMGESALSDVSMLDQATAFLVAHLEFGATENRVHLYVNPPLDALPSAPDAVLTTYASDFLFNRVLVRPGPEAESASFDEIRFGREYVDVTPPAVGVQAFSADITNAVFNTAHLGERINYLYAVDDDNDRPNDRLRGPAVVFTTRFDNIPPRMVEDVVAELGPDETSEIEVGWTALEDGGGIDGDPLSPWRSYIIYYTDEGRQPTADDHFVYFNTGSTNLADITTTNTIVSNLLEGTTYRLAVAGLDEAGNRGPLSTNPAVIRLAGFTLTQGLVRANSETEIYWESTPGREYDLISADGPNWEMALTSKWQHVASASTNMLSDSRPIAPGHIRFYRAAHKGRWVETHVPRAATEEVYAVRPATLYPGQNWVAYPGIPDTNTVGFMFGHSLPAASIASMATRISWYTRTGGEVATNIVWLADYGSSNQWLTVYPTQNQPAEQMPVPLDEGAIIELPPGAPSMSLLLIGRVPTNTMTQVIHGGQRFNLVSFRLPRYMHPSEMNLLESGYTGSPFLFSSDIMWKFDRATQMVPQWVWYHTPSSTWRLFDNSLVPSGYFSPDDSLVIWTRGTASDWMWNSAIPYPHPTTNISP